MSRMHASVSEEQQRVSGKKESVSKEQKCVSKKKESVSREEVRVYRSWKQPPGRVCELERKAVENARSEDVAGHDGEGERATGQ